MIIMAEVIDKKILKALSVDARQEIIKKLSKRPYTASELSRLMNKHVTTITEHLKNLEEAGLVQKKPSENKWVYYSLSSKGEHLFQPKYFTWVIVLSLSFIAFIGSLGSVFFRPYYSMQAAEKSMPAGIESEQIAQRTADAAASPEITTVIAVLVIGLAIVGMVYSSYRIKKMKEVKVRLK
jgi:DNA-binding transcriptional ArsR family regulator